MKTVKREAESEAAAGGGGDNTQLVVENDDSIVNDLASTATTTFQRLVLLAATCTLLLVTLSLIDTIFDSPRKAAKHNNYQIYYSQNNSQHQQTEDVDGEAQMNAFAKAVAQQLADAAAASNNNNNKEGGGAGGDGAQGQLEVPSPAIVNAAMKAIVSGNEDEEKETAPGATRSATGYGRQALGGAHTTNDNSVKGTVIDDFSTSASSTTSSTKDALVCVRENKMLHNCATRWWYAGLQTTTFPAEEREALKAAAKQNGSACVHEIPLIGRTQHRKELVDLQSKYIFEFYGDSTLRQLWERFIKAVGAHRNTDAKALVSMAHRGPVYAVNKLTLSDDTNAKKKTAVVDVTRPDPEVCNGFAKKEDIVAQHRSLFRFDFTPTDLTDPTAEVDKNAVSRIPDEFLIENLKGKAPEEKKLFTHHDATNNDHPKIIYFSFGVHPGTYLAATGSSLKERAKSYNQTKFNDDVASAETGVQLEKVVREAYQLPIFSWMNFFASRKNTKMLVFVENFVECNTLRDNSVKKNKNAYLRKLAPRCEVINKAIPFISKVIEEVFTLALEGPTTDPDDFNVATPSWVKAAYSSLPTDAARKRLKSLMSRAVRLSGFNCDTYNAKCKSAKCYCTLEGIHLGKKLSTFSVSEALGLVAKYDACMQKQCSTTQQQQQQQSSDLI